MDSLALLLLVGAASAAAVLLARKPAKAATLPTVAPVVGGYVDAVQVPSPFKGSRNGRAIDTIVLHYTAGGGSAEATAKWFQNKDANVSAHFVIGRDGKVVQCVPLVNVAWHAGAAILNGDGAVNARSVGIELCNRGLMSEAGPGQFKDASGATYTGNTVKATLKIKGASDVVGYWEPYPEAQIASLVTLVSQLKRDYTITNVVGHSEIANPPGRKTDPGPAFPWSRVR